MLSGALSLAEGFHKLAERSDKELDVMVEYIHIHTYIHIYMCMYIYI